MINLRFYWSAQVPEKKLKKLKTEKFCIILLSFILNSKLLNLIELFIISLLSDTGVSKRSTIWFADSSWKCWFSLVRSVFHFQPNSAADNLIFLICYFIFASLKFRYEKSNMPENCIEKLVTETLAAVGLKVCFLLILIFICFLRFTVLRWHRNLCIRTILMEIVSGLFVTIWAHPHLNQWIHS